MQEQSDNRGNILIGEGVEVNGTFKVPGKAMINGSLEGELLADELTVGPKGKLRGNVSVRRADIHGESHDRITVSEHLVIRSTGQIHGMAAYGKIEIERGGLITGHIAPCPKSSAPSDGAGTSAATDADLPTASPSAPDAKGQ